MNLSDNEANPVDIDELEDEFEADSELLTTLIAEPPPAPVAKSGQAVLCTEIPPPRMLRDTGYVETVSCQFPKYMSADSMSESQSHASTTSPPRSLTLNRPTDSFRSYSSRSPLERLSGDHTLVLPDQESVGSADRSDVNWITSMDLRQSSVPSSRDVTLSTYNSLNSPLEPQPLTMQLEEVRKLYRATQTHDYHK